MHKNDRWSSPLCGDDLLRCLIERERRVARLQHIIDFGLPAGDAAPDIAVALRKASDAIDSDDAQNIDGPGLLLRAVGIVPGPNDWVRVHVGDYLSAGPTWVRPNYLELIRDRTGQEVPREIASDDDLLRFLKLYRQALMGPLASLADAAG